MTNQDYPQNQGSGEPANSDIKDMLVAWSAVDQLGKKFVQFQNISLHSQIQSSPYSAIRGCDARVEIISSSLPSEPIEHMQSENDHWSTLSSQPTTAILQ